MRKPRGNGLAAKLGEVLADAPRPMFLGELEAALDFQFEKSEIMSVLVKLQAQGKVESKLREREGPGPRVAKAYALSMLALQVDDLEQRIASSYFFPNFES